MTLFVYGVLVGAVAALPIATVVVAFLATTVGWTDDDVESIDAHDRMRRELRRCER